MSDRVYLDWNATAPVRAEAKAAFVEAVERFGNPSSVHAEGRAARDLLEAAREELARFMGCAPAEVYFTSGGFEANNIALASLAARAERKTFASSRIEHGSIMGRLENLIIDGWEDKWLAVTGEGLIDPASLTEKAGFACFQAMNQETGALHDVAAFAARCEELATPWHCDAVQLWGRGRFSLADLNCATASLTGHKLGAPKGTGALFARKGFTPLPLLLSGPQERSVRPGTENVPGIAALAAAVRAATAEAEGYAAKCRVLREKLISEIVALYPRAKFNGPRDPAKQVPNTLSISFPGLEGALLVTALDLEGVAVSAGSACHSGVSKPSAVLTAMGLSTEEALGSLRVSMGWKTTEADAEKFLAALKTVLSRLPGAAG